MSRPDLDHEIRRLAAWRTGLHRPGGARLTAWMMSQVPLDRELVLANVSPQWGGAMVHVVGDRRPKVRVAVAREDDPSVDGRYTLWRRGTPGDTGLVVGSVDVVIGEGVVDLDEDDAEACLAEASRVLRGGGKLAFHVLARRAGASPVAHPVLPGRELWTPRQWAQALLAHGLRPVAMHACTWRRPTWISLALEGGTWNCIRRGQRLRQLGVPSSDRVEREPADLVGLAFYAVRR